MSVATVEVSPVIWLAGVTPGTTGYAGRFARLIVPVKVLASTLDTLMEVGRLAIDSVPVMEEASMVELIVSEVRNLYIAFQ